MSILTFPVSINQTNSGIETSKSRYTRQLLLCINQTNSGIETLLASLRLPA